MKILTGIDIPFDPFGGSPIICNDWYSEIAKNHEVLFLTMPPTTSEWWTIPDVRMLKTPKVRDPQEYPAYIERLNEEVQKIVEEFGPDVIHMQHINFGLSRSFIEVAANVPKIAICHGTDTQVAKQSKYFANNMTMIADNADVLVFPSRQMAGDFFEIYDKKKKHRVFPHGLPASVFAKHSVHSFDGKLKLLYAGRLNTYKGADIALQAVAMMPKELVSIDIYGAEDESGYLDRLKSIIRENDMKNVELHDQIERMKLLDKFSEYDCILIPSRELEAFSLTAVEAQARGLVVVYGNGGGIKSVIGSSGICIHDNAPSTLELILKKIISNPTSLKEYRKLGYKNAGKYKLSKQIDSLLSLSVELINNKENQHG